MRNFRRQIPKLRNLAECYYYICPGINKYRQEQENGPPLQEVLQCMTGMWDLVVYIIQNNSNAKVVFGGEPKHTL